MLRLITEAILKFIIIVLIVFLLVELGKREAIKKKEQKQYQYEKTIKET